MGIFDFMKGAGRDVNEADKAGEIRRSIQSALGNQLSDLNVTYDDGTVHLSGKAKWFATRQKAVLLAGNVKGVEKVDDSGLVVDKSHLHEAADAPADADDEATFYTIQKGDSLSKVAQQHYGNANEWRRIFEANQGVIDDPDKIYPGQTIRVPR